MTARRALRWLWVPALIWIAALLQRGEPLTWDELEFFRATRWIAEGQVPYRDFWEHHTPLQWIVFAPIAKLFGGGAGAQSVLAMRWAQVPLWIGAALLLLHLARRANVPREPQLIALLLLFSSRQFVSSALQYRLDALGNVAFLAGLALATSRRWIAFGMVMSLAVLANMRLAPLVIAAALLACVIPTERSERRDPLGALRMTLGVAIVAAVFVLALYACGAWPAFVDGVIDYNRVSNKLAAPVAGNTLMPVLLAPIRNGDVGGVALAIFAIIGCVFAARSRGASLLIALLFAISVIGIALTAVHYDYHLQTAWLLMVPLAAIAIERLPSRVPMLAIIVIVIAIVINLATLITPSFGKAIDYQNRVMTEVDARTRPSDVVFDGSGYALRRKPAYRYWFLAAGVRLMAQQNLLERYDIVRNPPAAIVFNYRVYNWLAAFPDVRQYALHHYVPLYRNLWLPGLSAPLAQGTTRIQWSAAADGRYEIWASPLLARHPWIARPMEYGLIEGPDAAQMAIPLARLPRVDAGALQWFVDGVAQPRGTTTLTLRKGSRVELRATMRERGGVIVAPQGIRTLCIAPEERFVF